MRPAVGALLCLLAGCRGCGCSRDGGSETRSAPVEPPPTAQELEDQPGEEPERPPPKVDTESRNVCEALCDRAVLCAKDLAQGEARGEGGDKRQERVIGEVEQSIKDGYKGCMETCDGPIEDLAEFHVHAKACLTQASCTPFIACMGKIHEKMPPSARAPHDRTGAPSPIDVPEPER